MENIKEKLIKSHLLQLAANLKSWKIDLFDYIEELKELELYKESIS